jgi:glutamine phosphoribosylpyrophosphate amidotransferase
VALAVALGLDLEFIDDALIRTSPIDISTARDRKNRAIHHDTMAVNQIIVGKNAILIDDVLVSGTTMSVCAELLMAAGAVGVNPVSIAQSCRGGDHI